MPEPREEETPKPEDELEEEETSETPEEEESTDDDESSDDEYTPEDLEKVLGALKKERAANKAKDKELAKLRKQSESDQEKAIREAREEATEQALSTVNARVIKAEAKAALMEAGAGKSVDRLVKLIETEDIEVDDDLEVTGLDEQVKALKKDFPELFSGKAPKAPRGDKKPVGGGKKSTADRLAAQLTGDDE